MEAIAVICVMVIILAIIVLYISAQNDKKEAAKNEEQMELTNETKIRLQFEKAKSDINLQDRKADFFNALTNLIGLFNAFLVFSIVAVGIALIAGLASCTGGRMRF